MAVKKDLTEFTKVLHNFYEVYLLNECKLFNRITKENLKRVSQHLCWLDVRATDGENICIIQILERIGETKYSTSYLVSGDLEVFLFLPDGALSEVENKAFVKAVVNLLYTLDSLCSDLKDLYLEHPLYRHSHGLIQLTVDSGQVFEDSLDKRAIVRK